VPELVALDLPAGPGFVDALRAVWDTGDAVAPLDPRLPPAARDAVLDAVRPTRIVGRDGVPTRWGEGRGVEPGDAVVLATSGSDGRPKGVVLTHRALAASARATSARLEVDPARHRWLACLPLAHIGGLSVITRALLTETPLTVLPRFEAEEVEGLGRSGAVTHVSLVATALGRLDPAAFVRVLLGGAAPPGDLADNVVTTYGLTETGSGVVYDGRPLDGVEVAVVAGQILVKGPMLLRAYRDGTDPFVAGPDGRGGWLATGDGGRLLEDGRLEVDGRLAEVIVTGAEKVWPGAVERVLAGHPGVAEVAVGPRPDPEWGQRVVAYVVPAPGPTPDPEALRTEFRHAVGRALAPWAAPKEVVLVAELPRAPSGKVVRRRLDGAD
jgi:O-succinylbenzoic acid--CoA ligase